MMEQERQEAIGLLTRARDLISDPNNWVQHQLRQRRDDRYAYCATGAMGAVIGGSSFMSSFMAGRALQAASETILDDSCIYPARTPISLNDTTDHETVMLMFKYAINALEQEED